MAFCKNCGTKVDEGVKFCPGCGSEITTASAPEQQAQPAANQNAFAEKLAGLNNTADTTADFDANDINQNKAMALLAYLGPLVFIPMFAQKDSKFARYHANQGLTLFIADVAYMIVQIILTAILKVIFPYTWSYDTWDFGRGAAYNVLSTILGLVWIVFAVLAVIGIINALNGKAKELPVIGKIKFLK